MAFHPIFLVLLLASTSAWAEIYKYTDADGNVTYSSQRPKDGEQAQSIEVEPAPTEDEVNAARERFERLQQSVDELEQARLAREAESEEKREKQRQRQEAEAKRQAAPPPAEPRYSYPYYYPYPFWPPYRPHPPGHHPHPPLQPPLEPPRPPGAGSPIESLPKTTF